MATDTSATTREETPHVLKTSRTNTILGALKRRAQAILNDRSIDAQTRTFIRYGLETNDPWLGELVRRVDAGECISQTFDFSREPESDEEASEETMNALTEIICRAGSDSAAALLVLMATLEDSTHPRLLANAAKHIAFTRCSDLNFYQTVSAYIAQIDDELCTN